MLIDPKIVEFSVYNHLPHLVAPVITDPKKVAIGLRWAINEMERRYKLFARAGVRNIAAYNSRPIETQSELFGDMDDGEEEQPDVHLPYIVIVIDELADLMLTAQAEIENSVARLAQLSRAVGIHMVLATQRPSVNVITGTIKANFPTRIAFQVASQVDSRTILDANGAEKLLGRGDMLFLPPGSSKLVRAQGVMITDAEIERIVEFIRGMAEPNYELPIRDRIQGRTDDEEESDEADEEMLQQAVQIIRETHRASTSSLQRRLRIGYTRAARIMDLLEERGVVGPPRGSDPREILIDFDAEGPDNGSNSPEDSS
jgi:S-DNA-T family DNA segregation ATPase FtsK/SpoIIIE